jgi:hypothetical protein
VLLLLALAFPFVLLGLLPLMEWIEAPLRSDDSARRLPDFLDSAGPDEIEDFVQHGLKAALERHWLRQRMRRFVPHGLPHRTARAGSR